MHKPRRLKITDLNPNLLCVLCGGYYVDATTIIECLHSFCKACIVRYLETNKYCPICDVQVHKTRPLQNIRSDQTLQDIVYKLVPGLFQNEMRCRRDFYSKNPEAIPTSRDDAGEVSENSHIYTPDEAISLSLEYFRSNKSEEGCSNTKRYFRCPAAVTIAHLQKLIRAKYGLSSDYRIDIMHMDDHLNEEFTLMDVAYIYRWRRKGPLDLSYRIFENCYMSSKRLKLEHGPCLSATTIREEEDLENDTAPDLMEVDAEPMGEKSDAAQVKNSITKEENNNKGIESWKEVQIQISENGVMSVTDISVPPDVENNNNTVTNCVSPPEEVSQLDEEKTKCVEHHKQPRLPTSDNKLEHRKPVVTTESLRTPVTVSLTTTTITSTVTSITSMATTTVTSSTVTKTSACSKKQDSTKTTVEHNTKSNPTETITSKSSTDITSFSKQSEIPSTIPSTNQQTVPPSSSVVSNLAASHPKNELSTKKPLDNSNRNVKSGCLSDVQNSSLATQQVKPLQSTQVQSTKVGQPPLSSSSGKDATKVKDNINNTTKREAPKVGIVAPTQSTLTNATATKKPVNSSSSSSPIGYKTLKMPPKSWNQSITRLSFLSSAKNHNAFMTNPSGLPCDGRRPGDQSNKGPESSAGGTGQSNKAITSGANALPNKPNRFFKMRNMPRYLGNPASGVKPMYQVASVNKQELGTQSMPQTSVAKPIYQVAPGISQQSALPPNSTASATKPMYQMASLSNCKPMMSAYHMGNQQSCKADSSGLPHVNLLPSSSLKQLSQASTNPPSTATSSAQIVSDMKAIACSGSGSNQQLYNKIADGGASLSVTTHASSLTKSMPSTCSSHSSSPSLSSGSSSGKSRGNASNKQETVVPQILGKSAHQTGSSNKPDTMGSPSAAKHGGVTLMKIDPKTLSPIVAGVKPSPSIPPLPLSPSPQSSLSTSQSQNLKTHPSPFPLPAHTNSSRGSASPNNPLNSPFLPNILYPGFSFPGMGIGVGANRMGAGPHQLVRAGGGMGIGAYHPLPPSINMILNPHHRTHAHNSTTTSGAQPGIIPPPAVQRIPATNSQHKNNCNANTSSSSGNVNTTGPNKASSSNSSGQLPSQNISHQRTPPPTSLASHQSKSHSATTPTPSSQALMEAGNNGQKPPEGKAQQKTVTESANSSERTVNGEESSRDARKGAESGGGGDKDKKDQGSGKDNEVKGEQGIASVSNSSSKDKTTSGESEQKLSSGKREVGAATQNQTKLKQEQKETGSGEAIQTKKQMEKT